MIAAFYIAAAVAIVATMLVVTGRNAVHSLLYLVVSLLAVAVIFFTLGAPFIGVLEIIIYAGAIMVLFIFVVMMLNLGSKAIAAESALLTRGIWWGPGLLSLGLAIAVLTVIIQKGPEAFTQQIVSPKTVALALFGPYALVVELASVLLLAGLIGAWHLARRRVTKEKVES